ncbi:MAG: Dihydroneopterin aldolase [Chlamydiae bacterium]|nr:Dihydroneopterin aldolase [Chlamydiota bacterium]
MQAKIHLKNLKVDTLIGARDQERLKKQPLIFDLVLLYKIDSAVECDYLDQTLDYSQLTKELIEYVSHSNFHLLEKLAHELALHLINAFPILKIELSIKKPLAMDQIADVMVEYALSKK